jgi:hypothetical protein
MGFIGREAKRWQWAWSQREAPILYPTIGAALLGALRAAYPAFVGHTVDWQGIAVQGVVLAIVVNAAMVGGETAIRRLAYWRVQTRREFVDDLVALRREGLYKRNGFESTIMYPNTLQMHKRFEDDWHRRIRARMEEYGCTANDLSRVSELTYNEVLVHAPSQHYGAQNEWLLGLLELRVKRLQELINKYNPD